ncbi:hypothetical protein LTR37_021200 [Vermiconidia calcicola]|uniref:Uncharacterized protein n=1 Tax=Vermiconidia calcicola TaxID=1690605 RepID=A0ACC3M9A5_9PEZI|nr:hypothetical protein LTR37_021200 [Vermiconidia calcicola]
MAQAERDEEAEAVLEYERFKAQGVILVDIGAGRVKIQKLDGETTVQHVNDVESGGEKHAAERF